MRGRLLSVVVASVGLLLGAGGIDSVAAESVSPGPAPGVSAGTQPASASIGSSAQPGSSASVGSGQTSSTADAQRSSHSTCGASVAAGGNGFAAQPKQVGTSGTSTPSGCASAAVANSSGGQNAPHPSTTQNGADRHATTAMVAHGVRSAEVVSLGLASLGAAGQMSNGLRLSWLLLALLLGLLFILIGVAIARRRQRVESV